jgi:DNA-binding PadR family transcriptional regulator
VSRPAVSQHLRILKDSGLVTERRQGTRRYYKARVEGLAELRAFLEVFLGEDTWIEPRPGGASTGDTEIVLTDTARPEQPVIT